MATQTKTLTAIPETLDHGMHLAYQIIKDSWLEEGVTEKEWERSQIAGDVFCRLVGQGLSDKEANDYLEAAAWEEIARKHQELFPLRYKAK